MLSLELEFLTGRCVATRHDDRDHAEWPPHPARIVFALVATAGRERTPDETRALEWLCAQPPPAITYTEAWPRTSVTAFVPVNDRSVADKTHAAGTWPRERQPRTFPGVVPEVPLVTYTWLDAEPSAATRACLESLAGRLVYVGHSSSLVRACVRDSCPPAALAPGQGNRLLRVPSPGLLDALEAALARYEATGVRGPLPTDYAPYGVPRTTQDEQPTSVFGDMVVIRRLRGQRLPLAASEHVSSTLRAAVMSAMADPVPPAISGHAPDGSRLQEPHVSFVALPDVGHPHATGTLLGVAAVLPRNLVDADRESILGAIRTIAELRFPGVGKWQVEPVDTRSDRPVSRGLLSATWSGPARRFATATPLELDRFVDDRLGDAAEQVVAASAERIGLPRPRRVRLNTVSMLEGGGHIREIRRSGKRPPRLLVHALLDFESPVYGPVLLGSGRYRGLGLCRPIDRP